MRKVEKTTETLVVRISEMAEEIFYVGSPTARALVQQIWFQSDKGSRSYKGVKITFTFFLLIYSWCGAPASWAARHTTVCLDIGHIMHVPGHMHDNQTNVIFHCKIPTVAHYREHICESYKVTTLNYD